MSNNIIYTSSAVTDASSMLKWPLDVTIYTPYHTLRLQTPPDHHSFFFKDNPGLELSLLFSSLVKSLY